MAFLLRTQAPQPDAHVLWRYLAPLSAVSIAILLRAVLRQFLQAETPFLLLFAAVLVSATIGGLWPGIFATVLAAIFSSLVFHDVNLRDGLSSDEAVRITLFVLEGAFISILGAWLQSARARAEQSEAQARALEQRILEISDDERRRIGQDLHDGLGQHLTGVAFLSKALQQRLAAQNLPEAEQATQIATLVSNSIGQTRMLAKGLAPVGLEDGGLQAALSQLAASTTSVFGVQCTLEAEEEINLDHLPVASHLYRIVQEALNNALRHGKARNLLIQLQARGNTLRLCVEDDGIGYTERVNHGGMGLQIMQFRAKMIGGSVEVRRREPAGGTRVICTAPLPDIGAEG